MLLAIAAFKTCGLSVTDLKEMQTGFLLLENA